MKETKEFNNILDECLERLLVRGETVEQCLVSYPEQADELEPLLQTALATKEALAIQPRPEFRARARYQFSSALREAKPEGRFFSLGWQRRWAMALSVVLILLLAGGGTVAAAAGSMPDSPLYPVKLATEQVWLTLTPSDVGRAEVYVKLVDRRVAEIIYMADKGDVQQVEVIAQRMDNHLVMVAGLGSMLELNGASTVAESLLAPVLSEEVSGGKDVYRGVNNRARLRLTLECYAANQQAKLQEVLEIAPELVKPALRRAIAVSETGYEKAFDVLD
jgi:hypothetical protein